MVQKEVEEGAEGDGYNWRCRAFEELSRQTKKVGGPA
jgi:hypothetical protein